MDVTDMVEYNTDIINRHDLAHSFFQMSRDDPTQGFQFDALTVAGHTYPHVCDSEMAAHVEQRAVAEHVAAHAARAHLPRQPQRAVQLRRHPTALTQGPAGGVLVLTSLLGAAQQGQSAAHWSSVAQQSLLCWLETETRDSSGSHASVVGQSAGSAEGIPVRAMSGCG